jgi:hypothetical protein
MRFLVRTRDAEAADELFAVLSDAGAEVSRPGPETLVVANSDDDLETELGFFLRAWQITRPKAVVALETTA